MQSTFYNSSEIEGQHGLREQVTLQAHSAFAEDVMSEKHTLLPGNRRESVSRGAAHSGGSVWHGVMAHTEKTQHFYMAWGCEVFWILFVIMATTMEMWGSCPFEMGLAPVCTYCYSTPFVAWTAVLLVSWLLHLYLFVLLVSRGFRLSMRRLGQTIEDNTAKGVPENAIYLFGYLSLLLCAWFVAGVMVVIWSNNCTRGGTVFANSERSQLMLWTAILNVCVAPILIFFGRCFDIGDLCQSSSSWSNDL